MQQKISKLFSFFGDIKNQPFYSSCISQLIQIYQTSPQSLKIILYNLNQLVFTPCKQSRLRLKHRQICASIISKLNKIYCQRVKQFIQNKSSFDLQSFQLEQGNIKMQNKSFYRKWDQIDIFKVIQTQKLLLATQKGRNQLQSQITTEQQQKKIFDQFSQIKHATMLNMQDFFKDFQQQNQITKKAYQQKRTKYSKKAQKYNNKNMQKQTKQIQLTIGNPFNLMYQICIQNMLHSQWQLRHLSVLILKQLILNSQFLGFSHSFLMTKINSVQQRFEFLSLVTKQALINHYKSNQKKKKIISQLIGNSIVLLSLDRFADYQTDQSLIIVRIVAAQILKISFRHLSTDQQLKLFKIIKRIFDRDTPIYFNKQMQYTKIKFTWQIKHSFLYFLVLLTQDKNKQYYQMIFKFFQQPFIKMLGNTQIDQVILSICKIFNSFVGEKFFQQKAIDRVNNQIWIIIETLDDIAISTKQTLSLLGRMFTHFKSNQIQCLERVKKFFTSKIVQVRSQFYKILNMLYQRNWKIPQKCKIIQQNTIQFLQAVIVQHQKQLFDQVLQLAPNMIKYAVKDRKIRKIVQFIKDCVFTNDPTSQILKKNFKQFDNKIKQQKMGFGQNQYLYFYEQDKINVPKNVYAQKRLWKISIALSTALKVSSQGLQQLIRGIQKTSQNNTQRFLLIYLLLKDLIPSNKSNKLFIEYNNKAQQFLKIQSYSQVCDPTIMVYIQQFETVFLKICNHTDNNQQKQIKQIYENYKKTKLNPKDNSQLHKNLLIVLQNIKNQNVKTQLQYLLSLFKDIIQFQNQLLKRLKLLCAYYVVKMAQPEQASGLNNTIKAISQAFKNDKYCYISQIAAQTGLILSANLYKKKKAIYSKMNTNLISKTQTTYKTQSIKLRQKQNCINLQSKYMQAISTYILKIGQSIKQYIQQFGQLFIKQITLQKNDSNIQKLNMLSGTIISILKIDHKMTFLNKFIDIFSNLSKNWIVLSDQQQSDIEKLIKQILKKTFIYYCQNYDNKSNYYFQWYIRQLQQVNRPFYKVLQKVSQQNLVIIAPVCSLFMMRVVKSISIVQVQDIAMNSLSNLVVGVYTNNIKLNLSSKLLSLSQEGIQFIKNFKDTSKFNYNIQLKLKSDIHLRNYQIQGITWLGFLCKYNLNGALCDDMGLGKTLQVLILIENQYCKLLNTKINNKINTNDNDNKNDKILASLIVVPTTLVQHWYFEYKKYFQNPLCEILMANNKTDFNSCINQLQNKNKTKPKILITNYNILQKNIEQLQRLNFKFIILDQGHIIKNSKTKKFKSVKRLKSQHRFILTGTPIQNRLKQLWGLFDFLMPGYLYTQQQFKKHYQKLFQVNLTTFKQDELMFTQNQKNILQKLHFKVMPFIMRRLKSQVLRQLPSKIINDYYCNMTQIQQRLYNKFETQQCHNNKNMLKEQKNILSILIQMRKILNHPNQVQLNKYKWDDSGKYIALYQLFQQLGFNQQYSLLQNKVIIFSRFTHTIDLIQDLFLKDNFPNIKYLKLTGNTKIGQRFQIAQTFNGDIDIKVLLVTTAVGGQGLNLSSANVVIMFDHDYNPTVDMQAIDRAHRIGQKRVLNVYRLITKDTLQQRIMGIQKFKTNLANAIVNIDNASIKNIKQSNLPDLLENVRDIQQKNKQAQSNINKSIYKQMLEQFDKNAIDTNQYTKKY